MFSPSAQRFAVSSRVNSGFDPYAFAYKGPKRTWNVGRSARLLALSAVVAVTTVVAGARPAESANAFMAPLKTIAPPAGFGGVCDRYAWVCAKSSQNQKNLTDSEIIAIARQVNRSVNARVRDVSDLQQYKQLEHWALPTRMGGDCEDFALQKKRDLIARGVAPDRLLIATALTPQSVAHAVLILRTAGGDLVLDNRHRAIKPWQETEYSYLRMQNPKAPNRWQVVLAGGMF